MYTKPLSDLIAKHPVNQRAFADDTQLDTSADSCNIGSTIKTVQCCASDSQECLIQKKLQLNEDKTEALLIPNASCDKQLPASIQIGSSIMTFVRSVKSIGVTIDSKSPMKEHVNIVCQMAYRELLGSQSDGT